MNVVVGIVFMVFGFLVALYGGHDKTDKTDKSAKDDQYYMERFIDGERWIGITNKVPLDKTIRQVDQLYATYTGPPSSRWELEDIDGEQWKLFPLGSWPDMRKQTIEIWFDTRHHTNLVKAREPNPIKKAFSE